jgi:DNA (cytosine-5)-methyltransferase 1
MKDSNIYYIDLFCGAGGVSTGVVRAGARVIFCINHDPIAIASHRANHPRVKHAVEDITVFDLTELARRVERIRAKDPNAIICLWASLECTHFSKAKGGEHREADSRTLAEHLYRYIAALDPDYIDIENVVEFMSWGPLRIACEKMHKDRCDLKVRKSGGYHMVPFSKKNGKYYQRWHQTICQDYRYEYAYKVLNSADFGALTARVRYFGQFKKPGLPFTWPEATHAKNPVAQGLFGQALKRWKAVRPALELDDQGKSIFGRKKPLSDNTLKRIYAGLVKYVGNGKEPEFIMKYLSNSPKNGVSNPVDLDSVAPTVTTQNRLAIVNSEFLTKYFKGDGHNLPTSIPAGTITTKDHHALVSPDFLMKYHGKGNNVLPSDGPCSTLTTKDRIAKLQVVWLDKQFRSDLNHQSVESPAGSILTNDKHCKVSAVWMDKCYSGTQNHQDVETPAGTIMTKDKYSNVQCFIMNQFSGGGQHSSPENPLGAVTTVPKASLIQADPWVFNHNYGNSGTEIDRPAPTLLASRKHYYLLNPQYTSKGNDLNRPCFTLIARMDKAPPSMIGVEEGEGAILIYEDDTEILKKIKLFMAAHGIVDIKMRMLKVRELLRIQGFGDQYKLRGTQTDQKRFIGNSVEVNLAKCKVRSRIDALASLFQQSRKSAYR